jgi:hypothetical protein
MILPLWDVQVGFTVDLVQANASLLFKFRDPAWQFLESILVVREKTAREESRGCASPPDIVAARKETDEKQPSLSRNLAETLGFPELWLN